MDLTPTLCRTPPDPGPSADGPRSHGGGGGVYVHLSLHIHIIPGTYTITHMSYTNMYIYIYIYIDVLSICIYPCVDCVETVRLYTYMILCINASVCMCLVVQDNDVRFFLLFVFAPSEATNAKNNVDDKHEQKRIPLSHTRDQKR